VFAEAWFAAGIRIRSAASRGIVKRSPHRVAGLSSRRSSSDSAGVVRSFLSLDKK
jgi:hypothetical protein